MWKIAANSCFLSTLVTDIQDLTGFMGLVSKSGSAFTDEAFVKALPETQRLFTETEIFNEDYNRSTNEDT